MHEYVICRYLNKKSQSDFKEISFEIFNSVNNFSSAGWNKISKENIFLQYNYLKSLEESGAAGISFRYVFIYENKIAVALCYFQLADLSSKEFGSLINLENSGIILSSIGNKINSLLFSGNKYSSNNLLVCGSLFLSGEHGIVCEKKYFPLVIEVLPEIIEKISQQIIKENGRIICYSIKDFYEGTDHHAEKLIKAKYHRMIIDPNMIFKIRKDWKNFDDYLNAMSAKYRLRTNNVLKKLEDVKIKILELKEIENEKEQIENLYYQVQNKAPVKIIRVNINYFLTLKKYLENEFIVRAFYQKDKMIAFTSGFKHGIHYEAHFIGIEYHYNKSHALYQNILYDFIHEAIKNKSEQLVFGRTAMEIKSTVGAVAYPLYSYIKFSNTFLNKIIKPFIPSEKKCKLGAKKSF